MSKLKDKKKQAEKESQKKPFDWTYVLLGVLVLVVFAAVYLIFFIQPINNVPIDGDPFKGPVGAKVVFVEFSDFQCPACGAAFPTIKRLSEEYSDRVKFVYKDFPIAQLHPFAQKAAEAGQCAFEQEKFWEYHDKLFENQENLTVEDLKQYAKDIGLEEQKFNECLDSSKYSSAVASDMSVAKQLGVNGTPTFFINGAKYSSMSYEQFKQIIDRALAK